MTLVRWVVAACLAILSMLCLLLGVWLLVFDAYSGASFAFFAMVVFCPMGALSARVWLGRGIFALVGTVGLLAGFPYLVGEVDRKIQRLSAIPRTLGGLSRFTLKDKLGIYGLNLAMGAAAFPLYPEVSRETLLMTVPPGDSGLRVFASDFPMGSARVRDLVKAGGSRLGGSPDTSDRKWEQKVAWPLSEYAIGQSEARWALALNPSRVSIRTLAREGHRRFHVRVDVRVEYPSSCRVVLVGKPRLAVEEGLFWVLQQEGWLHPYTASWRFSLERDDPRIR